MKIPLSRDKYCYECKDEYHDNSRNNQSIFCSPDCRDIRTKKHKSKWYKKNHVKLSDEGENIKFPGWICQKCRFQMQLDFDPLNWRSVNKLRNIICPSCKCPAIA